MIKRLKELWRTHPIPEILKIDNDSAFGATFSHEKYSQLISNNPKIKEGNIKHMDDFNGVNLENKGINHFMVDKIYS